MAFLIVTGMSGGGKSKAIDALEDMGYFCIDNVPPLLIDRLYDLCVEEQQMDKVAVVTDIRGGDMFVDIEKNINKLQDDNINYKILFLDCANDVLVNRFSETRRKHPLADKCNTLIEAIETERDFLEPLRAVADYVVDTTFETNAHLRERIIELFSDKDLNSISITCMSFGFKYGSPREANLSFDVRCFPNPFYIPELRLKTGLDKEVYDYVLNNPQARDFVEKLIDMIDFLVPLYQKEGKSSLVIAFGCTGGQHRSVTFAEYLNKYLLSKDYNSKIYHRDTKRNVDNLK